MVDQGFLVRPEDVDVDAGSVSGHGGELLSSDEPPPATERDQLPDPVAVAGDRERPTVLDRVHDLPGPVTQVALSDLGLDRHDSYHTPVCHMVLPGDTFSAVKGILD